MKIQKYDSVGIIEYKSHKKRRNQYPQHTNTRPLIARFSEKYRLILMLLFTAEHKSVENL